VWSPFYEIYGGGVGGAGDKWSGRSRIRKDRNRTIMIRGVGCAGLGVGG
jgi:hypothetical protein